METLSRLKWAQFPSTPSFSRANNCTNSSTFYLKPFSAHNPFFSTVKNSTIVSALKTSSSETERVEEEVLQEFFLERQLNGDLISKVTDIVFQKKIVSFSDGDIGEVVDSSQATGEILTDEPDGGFLKLAKTQEWLLGETSAPINRKPTNKEVLDNREKRRLFNLLEYEAIKRELLLLTVGVGAACTMYCLVTLTVQAAVSYAAGVGFSCLYLWLLYQQVDTISRDSVPQIFRLKKQKKIGIRSEDLQDLVEKSISGCGFALSSPRLVIPAAIYGLWILSHRHSGSDIFDFQIVPGMLGLFAYKAAALVQVYRDNEDLQFIFPDDDY